MNYCKDNSITINIIFGHPHVVYCQNNRVHRVATATFWRTFHHDGKISPGWWGVWGARSPPFTTSSITYKVVAYAPDEMADTLPLFLHYTYMYSVVKILCNTSMLLPMK